MSDETLTCLRCLQPYVYPVHQCPEPRERKPYSYPPKGASMGFGLVIGYASDTDDWGVYVLSPYGYPIAEIGPRGTKREAQQWIDQAARNGERITPIP